MSKPWKPNFNKKTPIQSINSKIFGKNLKDNSSSTKSLSNKIETKMPLLPNFLPGLGKCLKNTRILRSLWIQKKSASKLWLLTISFTNLQKSTISFQRTCKTSWLKIKFLESCMVFLIILVLIWKKSKLQKSNNFKTTKPNAENFKHKLRSWRQKEPN